MSIFLRHSYNIPPPRWGSSADIQYAVKVNAEKVYGINADTVCFSLPMFWGLPILDVSEKNNHITNQGATYKNNEFVFDGTNDYVDIDNIGSFRDFVDTGPFTINLLVRNNLAATRTSIISDFNASGTIKSFTIEFGGWLQDVTHITTLMAQANANLGYLDSGVVYDTTTYYHICVTFDGTTRTIFIQGKYKNSDVPPTWDSGAGTNTTIGRVGSYSGGYLNGNLKFLNIFKSSINRFQIALLNDLPYGLYQKVSRPFYLLPSVPSVGWTGEIIGVTNPTEILGRATSEISEVIGV